MWVILRHDQQCDKMQEILRDGETTTKTLLKETGAVYHTALRRNAKQVIIFGYKEHADFLEVFFCNKKI